MAGSQTIGTGAVVLTANADRLVAGLDRAKGKTERWAGDTTKAAEKAAGTVGAKGGILGKLLFGAGGFLLGVGAAKAASIVANAQAKSQQYANVADQPGIDRAGRALDRITAAWDTFLFAVAAALGPTLEKVAAVLEVVGFVGAEAFGALVDLIGDVLSGIAAWIDETFGLSTATTSAADQAFAVLRMLGKGLAYVWDTAKAGAGVVAYAAGAIVDGFGQVVAVIGRAVVKLQDLANTLPESLRPGWVGRAGEVVRKWGDDVAAVGARWQQFGKQMFAAFGQSAAGVDAWFDKVQEKFANTERMTKGVKLALAGAFGAGSAEAYSVVTKFTAGNLLAGKSAPAADNPVKIAKEQLKEAKEQKRLMQRWVADVSAFRGVLVIP